MNPNWARWLAYVIHVPSSNNQKDYVFIGAKGMPKRPEGGRAPISGWT